MNDFHLHGIIPGQVPVLPQKEKVEVELECRPGEILPPLEKFIHRTEIHVNAAAGLVIGNAEDSVGPVESVYAPLHIQILPRRCRHTPPDLLLRFQIGYGQIRGIGIQCTFGIPAYQL